MTNNEMKARQFIDKQRKRTATLGGQRHIYKVTANVNDKQTPQPVQINTQTRPFMQADGSTHLDKTSSFNLSPPMMDFTGETLYDSGMTIKQAAIVNQSQAQYVQNLRTTQM